MGNAISITPVSEDCAIRRTHAMSGPAWRRDQTNVSPESVLIIRIRIRGELVFRLLIAFLDVQLLQGGVRGGLLSGSLRVAAATRVDLRSGFDLDDKHGRMPRPRVIHEAVDRRRLESRLRNLLEARLGIDDALWAEARADVVVDEWQQHAACGVEATVQVDRAD